MASNPSFPRGAVLEFMAQRFGGLVSARTSVVTAGVAAVELVGGNPERVALTIQNLGTGEVFIHPTGEPTASNGIRLGASGGLISVSVLEDGVMSAYGWRVLGTIAATPVFVVEVIREAIL